MDRFTILSSLLDGPISIYRQRFKNNTIQYSHVNITINKTKFFGCENLKPPIGLVGCNCIIENSLITGCKSVTGGGCHFERSNVEVINSNFTMNTAQANSGACLSVFSDISFTNSYFLCNYALNYYGCIDLYYSTGTLTQVICLNNTAAYTGAIDVDTSCFNFYQNAFINNHAYSNGGAICLCKSTNISTFIGCMFISNDLIDSHDEKGGYIFKCAGAKAKFYDCSFDIAPEIAFATEQDYAGNLLPSEVTHENSTIDIEVPKQYLEIIQNRLEMQRFWIDLSHATSKWYAPVVVTSIICSAIVAAIGLYVY